MSIVSRSQQPPNPDIATSEEDPVPDRIAADQGTETASRTQATDDEVTRAGWRDRHPVVARTLAWTATALAAVLVLVPLVLPNRLTSLTTGAFTRFPVEALLLGGLLLVLPGKAKRIAGALAGVGIVLVTIVKVLDMGTYSVLGNPFDLLFDWNLIPDGASAYSDSVGHTTTRLAEIGVGVLVVALLVLLPLSVIRLGNVLSRHTRRSAQALVALGVVWLLCSELAVHNPDGQVFATRNSAALTWQSVQQVRSDMKDLGAFSKAAAHDPFAATPPSQLLTGLRGKNVMFVFVESYGRCAVQDPVIGPGVDQVLTQETAKLQQAGFASRSAFLTSATYGGSSWLGHSTFLSGMWVDSQSRYRMVTHSNRMPLTAAFQRTGAWRTVGIVPGTTKAWPEAKWEGLDHVYDQSRLGYNGPVFSWSTMPDQYALAAFQRLENGQPHDKPLMSEIILTSSHWPWAPIPKTIPWDQLGDGFVFWPIKKAGKTPGEVWRQTLQVRAEYGRSIQYAVSNLVDFVLKYGDKNTVLVFLGDHQPTAIVSGGNASHDVPVSIVAADPNVMQRISGWGWQDGLLPNPTTAPVWKMNAFRDRFLTAYGSQPGQKTG